MRVVQNMRRARKEAKKYSQDRGRRKGKRHERMCFLRNRRDEGKGKQLPKKRKKGRMRRGPSMFPFSSEGKSGVQMLSRRDINSHQSES
jgi:hypothetical protein